MGINTDVQCFNNSVFNWTFCQLLTEKHNCMKLDISCCNVSVIACRVAAIGALSVISVRTVVVSTMRTIVVTTVVDAEVLLW